MKSTIVILSVCMLFTSCHKAMMMYMGIKQPRIENNESITAYLKEAGISSTNIFHLDSASSHYYYRINGLEFGGYEIYNSKGQLLRKLENGECSGIFANAMRDFDFHDFKPITTNPKSLDSVLYSFERIDGVRMRSSDFNSDDFIVCVFYARMLGKNGQANIKYDITPLMENKDIANIKVLYLNVDMHESWKLKNRRDNRAIRL